MNSLTISTTETTKVRVAKQCMLLFLLFSAVSCRRTHPIGEGAATPKQALEKLLNCTENLDQPGALEVLYYDNFCFNQDFIMLNVEDEALAEEFIRIHPEDLLPLSNDPIENQKALDDLRDRWYNRGSKFRESFLRYFDTLRSMDIVDDDQDGLIKLQYEIIDPPPGSTVKYNELFLKKVKGKWYVYDLTCHAMK